MADTPPLETYDGDPSDGGMGELDARTHWLEDRSRYGKEGARANALRKFIKENCQ